ncbi:hypothetical protein HispidOSU_015352 [Sigmodon hispidus]
MRGSGQPQACVTVVQWTNQSSFPDGLPSVPVFDRTLPVKQIHVLEALDLLVLRADKGCHLYAINTHHSRELRIVVAIRNKLLLITRKQHNKPSGVAGACLLPPLLESPVEEFQYIREICLCDSPAVMTLVDGPTEESDNLICVAYRHQFDVVNESTGEAFRLHHVEANKVNFVAAIDVYEDGEAGLLLCYNYRPDGLLLGTLSQGASKIHIPTCCSPDLSMTFLQSYHHAPASRAWNGDSGIQQALTVCRETPVSDFHL